MVWTRGPIERTWGSGELGGVGLAVPDDPAWRSGMLVRGGALPVILPPPVIMHDPSDPATWTQPVRWT